MELKSVKAEEGKMKAVAINIFVVVTLGIVSKNSGMSTSRAASLFGFFHRGKCHLSMKKIKSLDVAHFEITQVNAYNRSTWKFSAFQWLRKQYREK